MGKKKLSDLTKNLRGADEIVAREPHAKALLERLIAAVTMLESDLVEEQFFGDQIAAQRSLERQFDDFLGLLSLGKLLEIYRNFPTLGQWHAYRYDLRALAAASSEIEKEKRRTNHA